VVVQASLVVWALGVAEVAAAGLVLRVLNVGWWMASVEVPWVGHLRIGIGSFDIVHCPGLVLQPVAFPGVGCPWKSLAVVHSGS
jgi:hypothetical protein